MYNVPNFIVVGAPKAGTTALYWALRAHPQIYMSKIKEPNFFSELPPLPTGPLDNVNGHLHVRTIDAYLDLFRDAAPFQICGEASPSYLYFKESSQRIKAFNDSIKIIMILRNPVDRAYSQFMHKIRELREPLDFGAALEREDEREKCGWEWSWMYKKVGLYADSVEAYLNSFGKENIKILTYDDFCSSAIDCICDIYRFLNVDTSFTPVVHRLNSTGQPRFELLQRLIVRDSIIKTRIKQVLSDKARILIKEYLFMINTRRVRMDPKIRTMLIEYYWSDIDRLNKLINMDLSFWHR